MALPTAAQLENFLASALDAAISSGNILRQYWGKLSGAKEKSHPGDLVTIADHESEKFIIDFLHHRYPEHAILAEESGALYSHGENNDEKFTWVIDPLDGTTNYTHQFPMVSVSIALLQGKNPVVAVVYNPITAELFHAVAGQGAFLDGEILRVSQVAALDRCLLATGFAYDRRDNLDNNFREFFKLTQLSQGVRRMGSAALDLAYVAAGRFDGYWERGLQPWDVAAGMLLVQEAGGCVTDYSRPDFDLYSGRILATNGHIHSALRQALLG